MAEEDLIFGKNRHFFGGIEPSNMIEFSASYDATGTVSRAKVIAKLPADTVIDGQTLCSVAGAVIRKQVGAYPKDEFDGILVKNISADETFFDEDVEIGNTYYYAAFPYTTQGVYNRNIANRSVCTIIAGYELAYLQFMRVRGSASGIRESSQPIENSTFMLPQSA